MFIRRIDDFLNAATQPRAAHDHRRGHVRQREVRAERSLAAGYRGRIDMDGVLADEAMLGIGLERRFLRHRQRRGFAGEFAIAQAPTARRVTDFVIGRRHFL